MQRQKSFLRFHHFWSKTLCPTTVCSKDLKKDLMTDWLSTKGLSQMGGNRTFCRTNVVRKSGFGSKGAEPTSGRLTDWRRTRWTWMSMAGLACGRWCRRRRQTDPRWKRSKKISVNFFIHPNNEWMEERVFVYYKNKLIEGSSENFYKALFWNKNNVILRIFYCWNLTAVFIINIFVYWNQSFCSKLIPVASKNAAPF